VGPGVVALPEEKMENELRPQRAKKYPTNVKDFPGNTE
jgi:hypothetical protein